MSASPEPDKQEPSDSATANVVTEAHRSDVTHRLLTQVAETTDEVELQRLRDEIVVLNLSLAQRIVSRYRDRGIPHEDLLQAAYLGLVKAVQRFDPAYERNFYAYAVPTVTGEVKRYFRDSGWTIRPPRCIQQLQAQMAQASTQLSQTLHRSPKPREVAQFLNIAESRVLEALAAQGCFTPASLDIAVGEHHNGSLGELLAGDDTDLDRAEARILLDPVLRNLSARDRQIIELRFFHGCTQQQIGKELGVTQMQVSRLLSRILDDLKTAIDERS